MTTKRKTMYNSQIINYEISTHSKGKWKKLINIKLMKMVNQTIAYVENLK